MTILVGIAHRGKTWLGADSAVSQGGFVTGCGVPKLWSHSGFVFGLTGSLREQQIIEHRVTIPALAEDADLLRWLCVDFVDAVREARKAASYEEKFAHGNETAPLLLIGHAGRLFDMDGDYQITERSDFAVHGSGREPAYGSLHTSAKVWKSPRKRIEAALEAACEANAYCRPPFTVIHT